MPQLLTSYPFGRNFIITAEKHSKYLDGMTKVVQAVELRAAGVKEVRGVFDEAQGDVSTDPLERASEELTKFAALMYESRKDLARLSVDDADTQHGTID